MKDAQSRLAKEVSALVHHIELNRSGWWYKTLNRLVLSVIWLSRENMAEDQITKALKETFNLDIKGERLKSAIKSLKGEDCLIEVSAGVYRIPEKARS